MLTTPAIVRAGCWLGSFALHAVAFVASGHPVESPGVSREPVAADVAIEVTPLPPEPLDPPPAVTAAAPTPAFAPPPTHKHPYPVPPDHDAHPHDPSLVHLPVAPTADSVLAPAAAPPVETAVSASAHFSMTVQSGPAPSGSSEVVATGAAMATEAGADGDPLPEGAVSTRAQFAGGAEPVYPPEARAQEVEADVVLSLVVRANGEVADAHVLRPAGFGLDEAALRAVRRWRFIPARRGDRPVAVRMQWSVSFRLR